MIIQLPQTIINKIAAGEVVERPASVLKELIENAIDAQATKITIELQNHGLKSIKVTDNGTGMTQEDTLIACSSHSTSKITTIDDLERITTMGFRGEALASISSVSALTLSSKTRDEKVGTQLKIKGGKKILEQEIAREQGTTVSVENLFQNIPARLKFLKSPSTEYKNLLTTLIYYALAFPKIHFVLKHNDKGIYNLPVISSESKSKELKLRIHDLFGQSIADNLVRIQYGSSFMRLYGFVGHPRIARSQRTHQILFINNRPVQDHLIAKDLYDAYSTLIPKGKYPLYILFIDISPQRIDVNVHPRKSEIRFENPQYVYKAVYQAARQTLLTFLKKDTTKALKEFSQFKHLTSPRHKQSKDSPYSSKKISIPQSKKAQITQSISFTKALLEQDTPAPFSHLYDSTKAFQVFDTYIILEKGNSLLIIDQHAAAERVTFDKLLDQSNRGKIETQQLLLPHVIELNKVEFEILKEYKERIKNLGIRITVFGKTSFRVEEIPILLAKADIRSLMADIISELGEHPESQKSDSFQTIQQHLAATIACHTSIRAGMKLQQAEIDNLIKQLLGCKVPYSCPHGRPIMWEITKAELEKKVGRH